MRMKRLFLLTLLALLLPGLQALQAQERNITGKVLDETGQGLFGAGVFVKGTQSGTITDANGDFTLMLPANNNVITVRAVGYAQQEITVAGNSVIIHMKTSARQLEGTVVTALGIRREKRALGYTQTTVDSAVLERSGEQNIVEALAAKSPGILVTGSGGTPGASSQILLRGNNTTSGIATPLFVVDGIPIDNNTSQPSAGDYPFDMNLSGVNESNRGIDINPNDIASISVLRGPAAAALYGVAGGNGAIIITTKRGHYSKGVKRLGIDFSSSVSIDKVNKLPDLQSKYIQGANGKYSTATPNSWGPSLDTMPQIKTYDKYKDFFHTGNTYANNLGLSWGSENGTFRLGLGNTKTDGVIPNTQFKRTTVNFRADTKMADWLQVGGDFNYTNSEGVRAQNGSNLGGIMLTLLRAPINFDITDYIDPNTGNQIQFYPVYDNPLFTAYRNPYTDVTNRVFGNIHTSITLSPSLTLTDRLGVDHYTTNTKQIYDLSSIANDNSDGLGQVNVTNSSNLSIYNDLILKYDKYISDRVSFSAFAGFNYSYGASSFLFGRGRNLQLPGVYEISNTSQLYSYNTESYSRSQGLFVEATLGYRSMLYLTVTGRNDWLSSYGRNGLSFFYPKADLSWIFSELIPRNNVLTFGKLRLAYADAGTGPIGYLKPETPYVIPFITDGSTNGVSFPYLGQAGYAPSNILIDQGIKPQHVEGKEVGLELRLFKNRVSIEATGYYQLTKDNIIQLPIAQSTGYMVYLTNGGTNRNSGIELGLNADIIKTTNFTWNVFGNFTMDRSKVLSINPGISAIPVGNGFSDIGSYALVGQPIGVFYGTAWLRDSVTGKILVDDKGRAIVDPVSRVVGDPNPDWTMGLGSSLSYKGLTFSFLWDIRHGGDVWNGTYARLSRMGLTAESQDREHSYVIDGIYAPGTPLEGEQNKTPVSATYYYQTFKGDQGSYAVENAIQDASWVRLRSVGLSYRISMDMRNHHRAFDYIELGVSGKNLLLFTKYKGVDPETSLTGASSAFRGYDYFNNPGIKSILFNLKLGL